MTRPAIVFAKVCVAVEGIPKMGESTPLDDPTLPVGLSLTAAAIDREAHRLNNDARRTEQGKLTPIESLSAGRPSGRRRCLRSPKARLPANPASHHGQRRHPVGREGVRGLPTIPGYQIEGELGRGGMGVVYKARQIKLNRTVALKMILAGDHAADGPGVRFLAEAEAVAKLQHPHSCRSSTSASTRPPYFEMEYVAGGSLADGSTAPPGRPRGRRADRDARPGHRRGASAGHRPSRLEAGHILLTAEGGDQDRRLRPGQVA